jgi:hypothetical protein
MRNYGKVDVTDYWQMEYIGLVGFMARTLARVDTLDEAFYWLRAFHSDNGFEMVVSYEDLRNALRMN